jgi:hypothetical protein
MIYTQFSITHTGDIFWKFLFPSINPNLPHLPVLKGHHRQWRNGRVSTSNVRGSGFEPRQGQWLSSSYEALNYLGLVTLPHHPSDETINRVKRVYAFRTSSTHYNIIIPSLCVIIRIVETYRNQHAPNFSKGKMEWCTTGSTDQSHFRMWHSENRPSAMSIRENGCICYSCIDQSKFHQCVLDFVWHVQIGYKNIFGTEKVYFLLMQKLHGGGSVLSFKTRYARDLIYYTNTAWED